MMMRKEDLLALFLLSVSFHFFTTVKCSQYDKRFSDYNEFLEDVKDVSMPKLLALTVYDLQNRFVLNMENSNPEAYENLTKAIITLKGDINELYRNSPLLIHSVYRLDLSAVKILLDNGADVNATDAYGHTALYHATDLTDPEITDFLINNGANLNAGPNLLVRAAKNSSCSPESFMKLLSSGYFDVNFVDPTTNEYTAIKFACENGNYEFFRLLLDNGADIFVGKNPLIGAAKNGHADIVHDLLELGADYSCVEDFMNDSLLHLAVNGKKLERARIVKYLLECGLEVDARNDYDQTPLLAALQYEAHPDVIRTLINNGADTSLMDSINTNAFFYAITSRNDLTENIRILMYSAPETNVFDQRGRNAMHLAAEADNVQVIAYLLGQGVDVNVENLIGLTPLNIARSCECSDAEKYLIENGAEAAVVQNLQEAN